MSDRPVLVAPGELELGRWVAPGAGIVFGQACAEPTVLVDALLDQAEAIGSLRAFSGLLWRERFPAGVPDALQMVSYGGLGRLGRDPRLQIVPCHYSALPGLFASGALPGDVAFVLVSPPDGQGRCSLGPAGDYLADALAHARVVIAEVNDHCPASSGTWIDWSAIDAAVLTSRPLVKAPALIPGDIERRIAEHVAGLVRDGDTIQIGVGALPDAILQALGSHERLGVHSGMITDGVLDLIEAGVITGEEKPADARLVVTGAALGSRRLLDALVQREEIMLRPTSYTHDPGVLAGVGPLCSINSALEIDHDGQVNCESIGERRVGAVGGQVDFLRAAAAGGGTGIIALPASRIVETLHGPVSTGRSDVDWVVTEHGARRLRGLSSDRRRAALRELAGNHQEVIAV